MLWEAMELHPNYPKILYNRGLRYKQRPNNILKEWTLFDFFECAEIGKTSSRLVN